MLNIALPQFQTLVQKGVFQALIFASFRIYEVLQAHHVNPDEDVPLIVKEVLKKFETDVTHVTGTPFGFKVNNYKLTLGLYKKFHRVIKSSLE